MSYLKGVGEMGWPAYPTVMDEARSRFVNELFERVKTAIAEATGKEVMGAVSEEIDPEFKEPYIRMAIYVDLNHEEYLDKYFDLSQMASKILIELYHEFAMKPVISSGAFLVSFDTLNTTRRAIEDLIDRLLIEILPMR